MLYNTSKGYIILLKFKLQYKLESSFFDFLSNKTSNVKINTNE